MPTGDTDKVHASIPRTDLGAPADDQLRKVAFDGRDSAVSGEISSALSMRLENSAGRLLDQNLSRWKDGNDPAAA